MGIPRQFQAQRGHLSGAEMVATPGAAQHIARHLFGRQTQHRQVVQIGAFAEHLAGLGPCGVQQGAFGRGWVTWCAGAHRRHHPFGLGELAREHHQRLPLRVGQQRQQARSHRGTRPAKGKGVGHHVSNQPAGIAWLEGLYIGHQQAHPRVRWNHWPHTAQAVAGHQAAARAALTFGAATRQKRLAATRQALGAQAGNGMGQGGGRGRKMVG